MAEFVGALAGRLIVCVGTDSRSAQLRDELRRQPGFAGVGSVSPLRAAGGLLANYEIGRSEAGLSALIERADFLRALRGLTDLPYRSLLRGTGQSRVVDLIPQPAERVIPWLRLLYPEAILVAPLGTEPGADVHVEGVDPQSIEHALGPALPALSEVEAQEGPAFCDADLIVILGAGRSGTTWLHRLLTAHPAVTGTPSGETWLFAGLASYWSAALDPESLGAWVSPDDAWVAMRRFADTVLSAGRRRLDPGARLVCEKTPTHVWHLPLISRLYPGAAFVHLVRDGRDVALSMSQVPELRIDPVEAARRWAAAVKAVTTATPRPVRLTTVRYEDLLADPVARVAAVLRLAGVEPDDEFMAEAARRVGHRVSPLGSHGHVGSGKWRKLPRRIRAAMAAVAGDQLTALGYR